MWDLRHFPHFSTADQTTSPSMNFKYEILGPGAVCHSCPKMCPAETLFFRGRFKHLRFSHSKCIVTMLMRLCLHGPNLEFSPVNVSLLEPPPPTPWSPPGPPIPACPLPSLSSLSPLSLSHSHLQMRMTSRAPSNARMGTLSTLLLVALNQQDFFISWKVSHASRSLACGICWPQLLPRTVKEIWGRNPRNPISPSGASHVLAPPPPAPDWAPKVVVGHGPAGALSPTKLPTSFHPCWTWDLCWWRL